MMKINHRRNEAIVLTTTCYNFCIILLLLMIGCQKMEHSIPYDEIRKIEVQTNQQGVLIFQIDYLMSSFCGIGTYDLTEKKDGNKKQFYLSLFRGEKSKTNINEDAFRGVKITIPIERFDAQRDSCWYLDTNGVHRIETGTAQSWDNYLRAKDKNIAPR